MHTFTAIARMIRLHRGGPPAAALFVLLTIGAEAVPAAAQWSTAHEQTYLPASHNWAFRRNFAAADRLFNAFDYGHAILYETLYTRPDAPAFLLEDEVYGRLTRQVLVRPPRLPLEEAAIEIAYARLVPEVKLMFDWAHVLHRQAYDVWADDRIPEHEKDVRMAEVLAYYRSRRDIAFSGRPKSMALMDGQFYSGAFRERYPRFNGLIWAYHWLQVGLYEPFLEANTVEGRQALVRGTVARFWQMLEAAPETMPYLMPMTAAVAPRFAARYPEVAIVFDNLHMMHDVVSDILASPAVARSDKRAEILRAAARFRDDVTDAITVEEWRRMALDMGLHNQGGAAVGFLPELPTPTVPRGMLMVGAEHAGMDHSATRPPPGNPTGAAGGAVSVDSAHGGHQTPQDAAAGVHAVMEFLFMLLSRPEVQAGIQSDARLRSVWTDSVFRMQLEQLRRLHAPPGEPASGTESPRGGRRD